METEFPRSGIFPPSGMHNPSPYLTKKTIKLISLKYRMTLIRVASSWKIPDKKLVMKSPGKSLNSHGEIFVCLGSGS